MDINEKNLRKLNRLLQAMDEDSLTRAEFTQAFKKVIDFVKKIEKKNIDDLDKMDKLLKQAAKKVESDTSANFGNFKNEISRIAKNTVNGMQATLNAKINELNERMARIKDGKDADEEKIIQTVLSKLPDILKIPTIDDLKNDVPSLAERIRDALELLQEEERLDVSAIKGLDELIKKNNQNKTMWAGGAIKPTSIGIDTPTGSVNGSNKTFTVTIKPEFVTVGGQAMYESNGWTFSSSGGVHTITFDTAPPTGSIIRYHYKEI